MSIKIERIALGEMPVRGSGRTKEFVLILKKLKVGESFLWPALDPNLRNGIGIVAILLEAEFTTRADGSGMRVMRIA